MIAPFLDQFIETLEILGWRVAAQTGESFRSGRNTRFQHHASLLGGIHDMF